MVVNGTPKLMPRGLEGSELEEEISGMGKQGSKMWLEEASNRRVPMRLGRGRLDSAGSGSVGRVDVGGNT